MMPQGKLFPGVIPTERRFIVPVKAVPWPRATPKVVGPGKAIMIHKRWTKDKNGERKDIFTPFADEVTLLGRRAFCGKPFVGPVAVELTFVFARTAELRRASARQGRIPLAHRACGDLDNLAKGVLDSLNGIAYLDDGQIYKMALERWYGADGEQPHVEIVIRRED